jgi:hypothetical protein
MDFSPGGHSTGRFHEQFSLSAYERGSADTCREVTRLSARPAMRLQLLPEQ